MIDPENFRVSREVGRGKLAPAEARDSFGYHIDVANAWETYRNPGEMLAYLGIHKTHEAQYPEILMDLGRLTPAELDWARRYLEFYDRVARLISTTSHRPELQFDIAETTVDWRVVQKFVQLPARILEYGAGGGRQCVSAFLRHADNVYTAIDSTLAAYTVQNLVFSLIGTLRAQRTFVDFLDTELAGEAFSDIAQAPPGTCFHVPAWFDHRLLPERFYDVIFACHVHGELSGADFRRLIAAVGKCLADEGVFYVRSELAIPFPKGFFDAVDLHGIDIVSVLADMEIVPVYCAYQSAFQTTVFARVGSHHYQRARASNAPESQFVDLKVALGTTILAGQQFCQRHLDWIASHNKRTVLWGKGFGVFDMLVTPYLDRIEQKLLFSVADDVSQPEHAERIRFFDPEVIVACGPDFFGVRDHAVAAATGDFAISVHHVMPMCFTYRQFPNERELGLQQPLRAAGDLDRALGLEARICVSDGGGLLSDREPARREVTR